MFPRYLQKNPKCNANNPDMTTRQSNYKNVPAGWGSLTVMKITKLACHLRISQQKI